MNASRESRTGGASAARAEPRGAAPASPQRRPAPRPRSAPGRRRRARARPTRRGARRRGPAPRRAARSCRCRPGRRRASRAPSARVRGARAAAVAPPSRTAGAAARTASPAMDVTVGLAPRHVTGETTGCRRFVECLIGEHRRAVPAPVSSSLRIGAFSRQVGISAAVLRAWETRYGLFTPRRTTGGFRLYGPEEERRVRRMRALIARGMAAAESARLVLAEDGERRAAGTGRGVAHAGRRRRAARRSTRCWAGRSPRSPSPRQVLPLLAELPAERRHFAQRMVETRLLGARRRRGTTARGPLALAGCGPGRARHDRAARPRAGAAPPRLAARLPRRRHAGRGVRRHRATPGARADHRRLP